MKDITYVKPDLPLIEVEEVKYFPDQWKEKLAQSVNQKGVQTSFDSRVKIKEMIDFDHPPN